MRIRKLVYKLTEGFNSKYESTGAQILSQDLPALGTLFALLQREKNSRNVLLIPEAITEVPDQSTLTSSVNGGCVGGSRQGCGRGDEVVVDIVMVGHPQQIRMKVY